MKKLVAGTTLAVLAVIGVGCSSGGKPVSQQTLTKYCVSQVEAIYAKHNLPYSTQPSERPALCDKWMADNGVTNKAEMRVAALVLDKELSTLEQPPH